MSNIHNHIKIIQSYTSSRTQLPKTEKEIARKKARELIMDTSTGKKGVITTPIPAAISDLISHTLW